MRRSVWPHDNGIIEMGFKLHGFGAEAGRIAHDISIGASHFLLNQLPELYNKPPVSNHLAQTSCHIACRRYNSCSIQKSLLNLPKVECLTLVSHYSGARGFSGALGFSAMLRYAVAGQDNALGSSVATLSTNCDAGPALQFALIVGASATPTPTR
jgi:hypothetical protein